MRFIKSRTELTNFRKTGDNNFEPLSEQELARLSNVEMPESIEIDDSDNNDHHDSSGSDSDAGWETTEEVDDDGGVDDQENDGWNSVLLYVIHWHSSQGTSRLAENSSSFQIMSEYIIMD